MRCTYFGEQTGETLEGQQIHACQLYKRCVPGNSCAQMVGCKDCKFHLSDDDPEFADKWRDTLYVCRRDGKETDALCDMLAGGVAFLVCGGPSADESVMQSLSQRGMFSLGINNKPAHTRWRLQAFACSDPPMKFHHSIWLDPGIIKFVPTPKLRGHRANLRKKVGKDFEDLNRKTTDCPNVWGFERRSWLLPDNSFFSESSAAWGNNDSGVKRTGQPKTVCTMLLGLRILRYLGARVIFLVGVDFFMAPGKPYSFNQGKGAGGCTSNNRQFEIINGWLCQMVEAGVFEQYGLQIYNTYQRSGLRAFPYVPFDAALDFARGEIAPDPDLSYWYDKIEREPEDEA